jgi:hypothetical protein
MKSGSYSIDCSDKPRRTLSAALQSRELSDEALAFVNGSGNNGARPTTPANDSSVPRATSPSNGVHIEQQVVEQTPLSGTVSMTFRLPSELSARLVRVSVERKLKREPPFSQQDIVADALTQWLARN